MAWWRQATSDYLSQCLSRSLSSYHVSGSQWVNAWLCCLYFPEIKPTTTTAWSTDEWRIYCSRIFIIIHSVESPSMVDPQWNIWYWVSKGNLHTVCWDTVGCEWGTTSVYFGITYVCFIPSRLPVFAVEPQYRHQDFLFLSKVSFEGHIQNLQKISC